MNTPSQSRLDGLKPCPFCGSAAALHWGSDYEVVNVRCLHWMKGCMGAGSNCLNEAEARDEWNRRALASETRVRISGHQIRLWADRHDISGSDSEIKAAFDDARSLDALIVNGIPTNEDPPSLR